HAAGLRGADAALGRAARDRRRARRLRAHRARPRLRLRLAGDRRPPRRGRVGADRAEALDRQRRGLPSERGVGARGRGGPARADAPGQKRWIGNGAGCHLSVVWARVDDESQPELHGQVSGFLVDQSLPGYEAEVIRGKVALRAIHQAHITLEGVRVPLDQRLPGARSFKDTSKILFATRAGVAWGALGHALACYEAALEHAQTRIQFGRPLAKAQHIQVRLASMLQTLTSMQLHCVRLAEIEAAGTIRPEQASLAKVHNTR